MSVDTYTVLTKMVLEDRGMTSGLRNIAKLARDVETSLAAARKGTNGLFGAALTQRADAFSAAMRRAQDQVRYFGQATSATSGAARLTQELHAANQQALQLARTLALVHGRGGGGGGGGPGHPTSGAGGHRGAGIFNHGFMRTAQDAWMIGQVAEAIVKPAAELGHQRALAVMMGEDPSQTQAMETAAFRTARAVPQISAPEIFKIERELLPVVAAGTPKGEDPLRRMIDHLEDASKTSALIESYLSEEKSGGSGHRMSQYYNALRSGELLGLGQDPKKLKEWTDMAVRAVIASGGRLDMNQVRQFVTTAGSAAIAMDPKMILGHLGELMVEQGGAKVGTMAATFMQSGAGRMTQMASRENIALGLLDPTKIEFPKHSGGRPVLKDNAWKDEFMRFNDPGKWAIHDLAPAIMKKLGVNMTGMNDEEIAQRMSAANLSDAEKVGITKELAHLFSDRNAQKFAEQLMLHATAMDRYSGRMDRADPDFKTQTETDPKMAWKGLVGAKDTLLAAALAGPIKHMLPLINGLSDTMTTIASVFTDHPALAGNAIAGIGGAGVIGAGFVGYSWMAAGPALNRSAAALTAAAARLGGVPGGGGAPGVVPPGGRLGGVPGLGWGRLLMTGMSWFNPINDMIQRGVGTTGYDGKPLLKSIFGLPTVGSPGYVDDARPSWLKGPIESFKSGDYLPTFHKPDSDDIFAAHERAGEGGGGGSGMAAIGSSVADAISTIVASVTGAVAQLTGQVTLTGDVHIDAGQFGSMVARLVAEGIAHATGGAGAAPTTGGRPDFSGGAMLPGPI
jgi:hypothetical protein